MRTAGRIQRRFSLGVGAAHLYTASQDARKLRLYSIRLAVAPSVPRHSSLRPELLTGGVRWPSATSLATVCSTSSRLPGLEAAQRSSVRQRQRSVGNRVLCVRPELYGRRVRRRRGRERRRRPDIITDADAGGGPHVKVFDGAALRAGQISVLYSFYAYAPSFHGGVRVAAADIDKDGFADIITARPRRRTTRRGIQRQDGAGHRVVLCV